MTGSTHQPPLCRLRRQQPAKKERKPCGLNDRTACLVRRLAPAERRSFPRLGRCRVFPTSGFSATILSNAWTPHRMRSRPDRADASGLVAFHPRHVSSAISAVLRKLHTSEAVTSNTVPKTAGQFAPSVRLRCKRRGHLPFRRQEPAGRSSRFSRPAPCGLAQAGPLWGPPHVRGPRSGFAGFTPRAPVTPSRCSIGLSCRLLCAPFTGCGRNMPASAGKEVGRLRTCFVFRFLADESGFRLTRWIYCHSLFQAKNQVSGRESERGHYARKTGEEWKRGSPRV